MANATRQPVAHLMPGTRPDEARIIVLEGPGYMFNNGPLLDERWLNDKMTQAEYVEVISSINDAVWESLAGLPRVSSSDEARQREELKATVVAKRVEALNTIWEKKGVRFTFQRGQRRRIMTNQGDTRSFTETFLYVRVG
jgi:hypothetical protein